MDVLSVVLILFCSLEILNVLVLYLAPGARLGNGVGVFQAYEKSKENPDVHALVTYLINWVAGTKLIFIVLLIGIVIAGNPETKVYSVSALIFSVLTFFSRLYPSLQAMDKAGKLNPKGYSRTLGQMIIGFVAVLAIALGIYLWMYVHAQ